MATLPNYQNLEAKSTVFDQKIINNKDDVQQLFINTMKDNILLEKNFRYIYRGVTNSRYKLFNSAQRYFIEKELQNITTYDSFVSGIIEQALKYQGNLLKKYFEGFNIPFDIPVLSFLQHYGAPTPLIDWTYNVEIALFFSTDGQTHSPSNAIIDNYFSIYCIDKGDCGGDLINISFWLARVLSDIIRLKQDNPEVDSNDVINVYSKFNYNTFRDIILFYISDFERYANIPAITSQTNLNIINQQGLFIFNSNENQPLEFFFGTRKDPFSALPKIKCYDIHKSLYFYVLNEITEVRKNAGFIPLTREFIYPQEEDIARNAYVNYLKL